VRDDGPGLAKGGTVTLSFDGAKVGRGSLGGRAEPEPAATGAGACVRLTAVISQLQALRVRIAKRARPPVQACSPSSRKVEVKSQPGGRR
jgi:hypothetical protein